MKTLSEKIIEQLQSKHDAFLGTEGELSRQRFKDGLSWAIDTVETLTNLDNSEKEYDAERCNIHGVVSSALLKDLLDGSEEVIAINGLRFTGTHEEKIKQIFDKHGIKYETPF